MYPMPPCHSLRLDNLSLQVHLGCLEDERSIPQEVRITLDCRFQEAPPGFQSDELSGTLCYAEISEKITGMIESRPYHLIEKMAADIYEIAKSWAHDRAQIALCVHKVKPPVRNLRGGSRYFCGDFNLDIPIQPLSLE